MFVKRTVQVKKIGKEKLFSENEQENVGGGGLIQDPKPSLIGSC